MDAYSFFVALTSSDLWSEYKKFMFKEKLTSTFIDYKNGDVAANNGYLSLIKLKEIESKDAKSFETEENKSKNLKFTSMAMNNASKNGDFEIVKWLHNNRTEECEHSVLDGAAVNGHLDILKWLKFKNENSMVHRFTTVAMDYASKNGHFEIVKWLHENRYGGCTRSAIDNAVKNGHLKIVKWLCQNRTEGYTEKALLYAGYYGYIDIFEFFWKDIGEKCISNACNEASRGGQLKLIKWVINNLNSYDVNYATPIISPSDMMYYAVGRGHLETAKWLFKKYPTIRLTTMSMNEVAEKGHLETLKFLHFNKICECTHGAMDHAARNGHLEIIKWLHENRTEGCSQRAMDFAAKNGHLDIVIWLHENRTEGCTFLALYNAILCGNLEIVKWLHRNRHECIITSKIYASLRKCIHPSIIKYINKHYVSQ